MKTRPRLLAFVAILIVGLLTAIALLCGRSREPVFEGRQPSQWLTDLGLPNSERRSQALGALRQMGPQAVPFLLADLDRKDSFLKAKSVAFLKSFPSLPFSLMSADDYHHRAITALRILNPHSKQVIEALNAHLLTTSTGIEALNTLISVGDREPIRAELVESLTIALRSADVGVRRTAASEMRRLPQNNLTAITALQRSLGDPDKSVQRVAAWALTSISTEASIAVPAYVKLFEAGDPGSQTMAIDGFVRFETQAVVAVPKLMNAAEGEHAELRRLAVYALGRIHSDGERVIPLLVGRLEDADSQVCRNAAFAIGAFGNAASNAIPALLKAKESKVEEVRDAAGFALNSVTKRGANHSMSRFRID